MGPIVTVYGLSFVSVYSTNCTKSTVHVIAYKDCYKQPLYFGFPSVFWPLSPICLDWLGLVILPNIPGTLEMVGHRKSEHEWQWANDDCGLNAILMAVRHTDLLMVITSRMHCQPWCNILYNTKCINVRCRMKNDKFKCYTSNKTCHKAMMQGNWECCAFFSTIPLIQHPVAGWSNFYLEIV